MSRRLLSASSVLILVLLMLTAVAASGYNGYIPKDPGFMSTQKNTPYPDYYNPKNWLYDEQFFLYGFAPDISKITAIYKEGPLKGKPQISGVSADLAWMIEQGDASVMIAIIDTGAYWYDSELIKRYALNADELPPAGWDTVGGPVWDANGDGGVTVEDYQQFFRNNCSGRTDCISIPDTNGNGRLDPQDMIRTFSNGMDEDGNGFTDDICGWDFFEDDNDPEDTSSYFASRFHGSDMSRNAVAEHDNGIGGSGVCPHCTILPLKSWNSFLQNADYYGMASIYAAIRKAAVAEGACGVINNSGLSRDAVKYAYDSGVVFFNVSSDLNSANHNFPTYFNEPIYCSGAITDTYPIKDISPTTYFRNSNLTQWGGKAMICFEADSGSNSTSMSAGAGGLIVSRARKMMRQGLIEKNLHPDQVKQIITLSAEDVLPKNTGFIGTPDPSQSGWDQHFGYGRVNVFNAVSMVEDLDLPPVARITSPSWFAYLKPADNRLKLVGDIIPAAGGSIEWTVEAGIGIEPAEPGYARNVFEQARQFRMIRQGTAAGTNFTIADIGLGEIRAMFPHSIDMADFPREPDSLNPWEADIQPNRNAFTLRIRVTERAAGRLFTSEDRRVFMLVEDRTLHQGWPIYIGEGGDAAPRFADLDGDNLKELILATAGGRILIYNHDGTPFTVRGKVVEFTSDVFEIAKKHGIHIDDAGLTPSFCTPSVADIDDDGIKEIVATAGMFLYCFKADGSSQFDPIDFGLNFRSQAKNGLLNENNPIGPGAMAAPVLFDIDSDGKKEIILASFDQNIYAWHSNGTPVDGWPVLVRSEGEPGAMLIHPPCIADIDGDGKMEIVASSNEVRPVPKKTDLRSFISPGNIPKTLLSFIMNMVTGIIGKDCMVYALNPDGNSDPEGAFVKGWPIGVTALMPDMLPQVGPSAKPCALDIDGDGRDEIVASAETASVQLMKGSGKLIRKMDLSPFGKNAIGIRDRTLTVGMLDSPCIGDIDGDGTPEIAKTGITMMGALNMGLAGQNFPYNQVISVWNARTGRYLKAFPRTIDDILFYSEPAMADISGDGIPEVIIGTGLYLLHAIGADGMDKNGFPKQTGGWICTTPVIDDIDGDGLNEVATVTREGWIFIWDTNGIQDKVTSWPTYGHDNFTTSNISTDAVPPAAVTDIRLSGDKIMFTCPGDDGFSGTSQSVRLYGSNVPIDVYNVGEAVMLKEIPTVKGGTTVTTEYASGFSHYAVVAFDEAGNTSQLPLTGKDTVTLENSIFGSSQASSDGGSGGGLCFVSTAIETSLKSFDTGNGRMSLRDYAGMIIKIFRLA